MAEQLDLRIRDLGKQIRERAKKSKQEVERIRKKEEDRKRKRFVK